MGVGAERRGVTPNCLGDDVLRVLRVVQLQLVADVGDRDARVRVRDAAQPWPRERVGGGVRGTKQSSGMSHG